MSRKADQPSSILGSKDYNSSRCASAGSCPAAHRQQTQRSAQHTYIPHMDRRHHQQQRHCGWVLVTAVLVWTLLAGPCQALPNVDISIGPPTATTAAISYTWGLAASVTPPQVAMQFTEARPITWIINATRSYSFTGTISGSVRIARTLTNLGAVAWSAVGISVRQGDRVLLSTNAVCTPGNQFLPQGSSSDQLAQVSAVVNCAFTFGPNLGVGATPFSPSGLPPDLLGEASPNRVFELAANVTLTTGQVEQATGTQTFTFDMPQPIIGECATVQDTWAQVSLPVPLGFSGPTDGVSNPAAPAPTNPPNLQQRICAPAGFAYVSTIPASQATQGACGEWAFTAAASLTPSNGPQGTIGGSTATRTARASISGCTPAPGQAAPGVPQVPPVVPPPFIPQPVIPPQVVPPPAITPVVPQQPQVNPVVVPPPQPAIQPVPQPAVPPPAITPVMPTPPAAAPQPAAPAQQQPPPANQPAPAPPGPAGTNQPGTNTPPAGGGSPPSGTPAGPAGPTPSPAPAGGSAASAPSGSGSGDSAAVQGPPALASNSSGGVAPDSSSAASAPVARYVAPVLPTAAPQPLSVSITSVGGYQINRAGSIWSARTSSSPEQLFLRSQSSNRVTFTVNYQKASLSTGAFVMGSISITNPNPQVASVPGLAITVAGQGGGSGTARNGARQNTNSMQAQVDCVSGQANQRNAVGFKVPSGGSITCTFITQLPNFSSSSDGGTITAAVNSITLGASGAVTGPGSSTEITPWSFAPSPIAAAGDCARVTASVTPTNDRLQVVGPTDSLTGEVVPAAGKVICSGATYTFSGEFGPIGSKQGRRCGAHAILSATARPQGSGLSTATARGTTVVPIDEPDCQKGGDAAASADSSDNGNPAVQVLKVGVADLAPTSVTEYAWRVKLAMKPPKDPVKFSENATVKSEVEVTRSVSSSTRRLSGTVNIENPSDRPFTILEVRVNATLAARRRRSTSSTTGNRRVDTSSSSDRQPASRGLRRLLRLLQQGAGRQTPAATPKTPAAGAANAAKERGMAVNGPTASSARQQSGDSDSALDLFSVMLGRPGGPTDNRNSASTTTSSSSSSSTNRGNSPSPAPGSSSSSRPPAPTGPSVAATVTCPTDRNGAIALPAATRRGGGSNPSSVSCKFTVTMPPNATLATTGRLQVVVVARPAAGGSGSSSDSNSSSAVGRVRGQGPFALKDSKPQTVGSCARITVAPAAQQLAPNPSNLLRLRATPAPTQSEGRNRPQQSPPAAPDSQQICDSTNYAYDELVGPVSSDACGSYQVVSLATVEPEGASQGAQQVLSSASIPFNGCNGTAAAVPTITINSLKMINFTTFTWTLNQSAVTSSQVALIPVTNDTSSSTQAGSSGSGTGNNATSSSSSSAPSAAASAAAASTSTAAVNVSASAYLLRTAPGVLVIPSERDVTESVTLVTEITRLPGVESGLFGLEGQVVASAPGKEPMEVAGLKVAVARPGDVSPLLVAAICPPPTSNSSSGNSSRSAGNTGSITLPPAPATITCTFNYTTSSPAAGLVGGVVVLPAASGSSGGSSGGSSSGSNGSSSAADTSTPSFIGATQSFGFAADNTAVTKQNLGDCVTAAELTGIEAQQGEDLMLPPARTQNDIGLPQLWKADASGKNVTLLPSPKTTRGTGLSDKTRLCESRTLNVTLQFGPFNNRTCGTDSQFFAAARVAPTPLQPKGLTREFVLLLEVPCSASGSSSSGGGGSTGRNNSTGAFFRPTQEEDSGAGNERGMRAESSGDGGGDKQDGSAPSSRGTDSRSGGQGGETKGSIRGSSGSDAAVAEQEGRPDGANAAD